MECLLFTVLIIYIDVNIYTQVFIESLANETVLHKYSN